MKILIHLILAVISASIMLLGRYNMSYRRIPIKTRIYHLMIIIILSLVPFSLIFALIYPFFIKDMNDYEWNIRTKWIKSIINFFNKDIM